MTTTTLTKTEVENNLVEYFANSVSSEKFVEKYIIPNTTRLVTDSEVQEICEILAQSQKGWEALDCDSEGATKEQEQAMDAYIDRITSEIMDVVNANS